MPAKTVEAKASKKPRSRKPASIDGFTEVTGALEPAPQRSVEDMLGYGGVYTTDKVEDYLKHLDTMSDADLQSHAVKIGVTPPRERNRLRDRLERHFLTTSARKVYQPQRVEMSEEALARQQRLMQGRW